MTFLSRLLQRLHDWVRVIAGLATILMMLHITADVALKHFAGFAPPGTIAIVSTYYMVIVAFLPLAMVERRDGHITVEVLADHFPPKLATLSRFAGLLLSMVIFAVLTAGAWSVAVEKYAIGAFIIEYGTPIPVWPSYFLLPLGTGLMTLVLGFRCLAMLTGREDPTRQEGDARDTLELKGGAA
ncbi:TRAP transporter small permease [Salipiger sp.]|uniref:TRAP transporter small permease n=1 Tax=Salipiger sp. TaxID=2078585 RepID=UPI003A96D745